jgi:hypothetical protein
VGEAVGVGLNGLLIASPWLLVCTEPYVAWARKGLMDYRFGNHGSVWHDTLNDEWLNDHTMRRFSTKELAMAFVDAKLTERGVALCTEERWERLLVLV